MKVILVHGEYAAQQTLAKLIRQRLGCEVYIPDYLEEITLKLGAEPQRKEFPEKAAPPVDWASLLGDLENKMALLRERRARLEARGWVEQTEFRDRLQELSRNLGQIASEA
jgi:metallo-beta-lactamase family protein